MVAERWHPETRITDLLDVPAWAAGLTPKEVADNWPDVLIECLFEDETGDVRPDINRRAFCLAIGAIRARLANRAVLVTETRAVTMAPRGQSLILAEARAGSKWEVRWRDRLAKRLQAVGDECRMCDLFTQGSYPRIIALVRTWPEFEFFEKKHPGGNGRPAFWIRRVAPDPVQAAA